MLFVEGLRQKYERVAHKRQTPEYSEVHNALRRLRRNLVKVADEEKARISDEIRRLKHKATTLNAFEANSLAVRIKYVRYADAWLIGLAEPRNLAEALRDEIEQFLATNLKLTLNREKSRIRHAKTEEAFFLGTRIKCGSETPRVITYPRARNGTVSYVTKRRIAYILQFSAAKTLAHRHQISMRKVFAKHGAKLSV